LWGPGPTEYKSFVRVNREIEAKVTELGGVKTLYAHTYYTEEEFFTVYDRSRYEKLRKKYNAEGLPSVWEKTRVDIRSRRETISNLKAIWPLGGLYGVLCVLLGKNYLMKRDSRFPFGFLLASVVVVAGIMALAVRQRIDA